MFITIKKLKMKEEGGARGSSRTGAKTRWVHLNAFRMAEKLPDEKAIGKQDQLAGNLTTQTLGKTKGGEKFRS